MKGIQRKPENLHLDSSKQAAVMGELIAIAGNGLATRTAGARINVDIGDDQLLMECPEQSVGITCHDLNIQTGSGYVESFQASMAFRRGILACSTVRQGLSNGIEGSWERSQLQQTEAGMVWHKESRDSPEAAVQQTKLPSGFLPAVEIVKTARGMVDRAMLQPEPINSFSRGVDISEVMELPTDRFLPTAGKIIQGIGSLIAMGPTRDDKYIGARIAVDLGWPGIVLKSPADSLRHRIELHVVNRNIFKTMRLYVEFEPLNAVGSWVGIRAHMDAESFANPDIPVVDRERLIQYGPHIRVKRQRQVGDVKGPQTPSRHAPPTAVLDMARRVINFARVTAASSPVA